MISYRRTIRWLNKRRKKLKKQKEKEFMSLAKGIKYGKEHRKEYYDSRAVDRTCRSHGSCPWCSGNRFHKYVKQSINAKQQLEEYLFPNNL